MKNIKAPTRTSWILYFFIACLGTILIRVWFLTVVQYDFFYIESRKPQRRYVIEQVDRGTIHDRFGFPLAVNQTQYNVAICYADIRQIPRVTWEEDPKGKKRKIFKRKEHIEKLAQFLSQTLAIDQQAIEDTIHGKASLFPHTPFVLKEDVPETLYYRLKIQEKDWIGMRVLQGTKRIYPQQKVGCDLIGYMGSIGPLEYLKISRELEELKQYLSEFEEGKPVPLPKGFSSPQEASDRYQSLKEKSYTINDLIGKSGVEGAFDEKLRGKSGKKVYEIDINGNILNELPERIPPIPGEELTLSFSVELQKYAEELLTAYEKYQEERDQILPKPRRSPWQRGGAIVALDPHTGEILACASYPRFNPNDFVPAQSPEKKKEKRDALIHWLENEAYLGEVWDGKRPLQRELFSEGKFYNDERYLTWDDYLDTILNKESKIYRLFKSIETVGQAVNLPIEEYVDALSHERDKKLFVDLLQLIIDKDSFTPHLLSKIGNQTLGEFHIYCQTAARALDLIKKTARTHFRQTTFKQWRDQHFSQFLKEKRKLEKKHHTYARPYTDYLEKEERERFDEFWKEHRHTLLYASLMENRASFSGNNFRDPELQQLEELLFSMNKEERLSFLKALRTFEDLDRPLKGKYPGLRSHNGEQLQRHLATAFYPYTGYGMGRSQAYRQASPMGSIFKLIPSYAGLKARYLKGAKNLNPLTLIDDMQWVAKPGSTEQILGYFENGEPIKRLYKGGRLPRAYPKIGKIDLVHALERSSNIYFSILASDVLESPSDLTQAAIDFGLGRLTGVDLPDEYKGILPDDILHNKTGLYSFAIGQHSLVVTPLQTARMLAAIANGGKLLKPQIVKHPPEVQEEVFLPEKIRSTLLEGMYAVTNGERGSARLGRIRPAFYEKEAVAAYKNLHSQIVGKTGTAEIMYKQTLDAESKAMLEKHVWFGAISFENETLQTPELVVVVYHRFGSAGGQGAPLVAALTQKWRELKAKNRAIEKVL